MIESCRLLLQTLPLTILPKRAKGSKTNPPLRCIRKVVEVGVFFVRKGISVVEFLG
jgi:hypothetical protein